MWIYFLNQVINYICSNQLGCQIANAEVCFFVCFLLFSNGPASSRRHMQIDKTQATPIQGHFEENLQRKYNQIQKHCRKHRRPEKPCPGDTTFQRLETVSIVVCATWSRFLTLHLHSLSICSYILMFCMYYSFLCSLDPYRNSISACLII